MSQPRGRTITQRVWNSVRGTMQLQGKKDAELLESVRVGDFNRVLKYLGRGAKIMYIGRGLRANNTFSPVIDRLWVTPGRDRTEVEIINDLDILRALSTISEAYISELSDVETTLTDAQGIQARMAGPGVVPGRLGDVYTTIALARQGRLLGNAAEITGALVPWINRSTSRETAEALRLASAGRGQGPRAMDGLGQARRHLVQAPRGNEYHVHNETNKFREKIPRILELIKRDLGGPKEYSNIEAIFEPIYTHIRTNSAFETKKVGPNSVLRAQWETDLGKIKDAVSGSVKEKKVQMGLIFDFIIKHTEITECFITGFVYDCSHAYANGHLSCYAGIIERTVSTLLDCIKGTNEGIFGEINEIIELGKTWRSITEEEREAYKLEWARFYDTWATNNKDLLKSTPWPARIEALMTSYGETVPPYVLEGIKILNPSDQIKSALQLDYDYEDPVAAGGRRKKTRRHRKSKRTRRR